MKGGGAWPFIPELRVLEKDMKRKEPLFPYRSKRNSLFLITKISQCWLRSN